MSFVPRTLDDLASEFPPQLQHLSASGVKMMVRCKEQWRQRYILGKKEPPNLNLLAGSADHAAVERNMTQKVESGVDIPEQEVRDAFLEALETKVEEAGGLPELVFKDADTRAARVKEYDAERKLGAETVATWHNQVAPVIQPLMVEEEFRIEVPELPVELYGYIDLRTEDRLIDRKRVTRKRTVPEAEWVIQGNVYQYVYPLPFEFQCSVKKQTPEIITGQDAPSLMQQAPPQRRTAFFLSQLVAEIGFLYQRYGPDEPWPTGGKLHPWACNYCGFRSDCWGWQ